MDVLATGPVVREVSRGFDRYWNSTEAYPGALLTKKGDAELLRESRAKFGSVLEAERAGRLRNFPIERQDWSRELAGLPRKMVDGRATFVQDEPEDEEDDRHLVGRVSEMISSEERELQFASPYLIPSDRGIDLVAGKAASGTDVSFLVPSLSASDHAIVDGHYDRSRKRLVDTGASLHEFRGDPSERVRKFADTDPIRSDRVTLHLKAVVGNRDRCFVGSLNLDPRALKINTESGMMIESAELSGQLAEIIDLYSSDENAWKVSRDPDGRIQWQSRSETRRRKPKARWTRKVASWFGGLLPIKDQI